MLSEVTHFSWNATYVRHEEEEESSDSELPPSTIEQLYTDFSPPLLCMIVSRAAYKIFNQSYFDVLFIASTAFLFTTIIRKVFQDYTFFIESERIALVISNKWPYLPIIIGIVASVVANWLPLVSIALAASVGLLTAMTFRVTWLAAVTESRRKAE